MPFVCTSINLYSEICYAFIHHLKKKKKSCFKLWETMVQCMEQYWRMAPVLLLILYFFFFFLLTSGKRCCVSINFLAKKANDSSFRRREDGESELLDRALGLSLC